FGTAVLVGWFVSRARNLDHAAMVAERVPPLKAAVDALPPPATADVTPLPLVLAGVRDAAKSEAFDIGDPPLLNGLGLYQGEKLDAAAQLAYTRLLEKSLMPRVSRRLEERLRAANRDDLENAYEALKTYQMLYLPEQFDAATLRAWVLQDWDQNYARMAPEQRAQLEAHLDAMLALGPLRSVQPRDDTLVAGVREMLAAFPLEYRVYSRIRRGWRPGEIPEFTAAGAAGPNAAQVFRRASGEPLTKGIPGLYTKAGYERYVKPQVPKAASQMANEESWVLGFKSDPGRLKDMLGGSALNDKVKRRYFEEYIKVWDQYIADVKLVPLTGLDRSMAVARTLGSVDSPLAAWLRGITEQTKLVPPPQAPGAIGKLVDKAEAKVAKVVGGSGDSGEPAERLVDDHFASIHRQVTGTPPPIDETLKLFTEVYNQLAAVDAAQKSKSPLPPGGGGGGAIKAAAAQLPDAVRAVVEQLADAGASQSRGAEIQGLSTELKPVTEFCERVVVNRYPFASGSRADTPLEDFGQLFGGGGMLDDFFAKRLQNLVDTTAQTWAYKPLSDGSKPVAAGALAEFQRAARIRDVFFRAGGKVPAMKVEMRIADMDPALKELVLDIDGQVQKLTSGGQPISISWPSQRLASQIKLSTGLGNAGTLVMFEGPWALFRFIDRFEVQPSAVPERFTLVMNLDGKRARVDVITSSVFNPFQMREVKQFRCPAAL
ncbi:MAG: type VI secretion system membrane subunit TssM, partial [Rubrivivax sp.]